MDCKGGLAAYRGLRNAKRAYPQIIVLHRKGAVLTAGARPTGRNRRGVPIAWRITLTFEERADVVPILCRLVRYQIPGNLPSQDST
ncbi:MAG TPA: hypothetical protein DDW52_11145 [Planctomycetaceae bacterium]|nr:hypothetical protein [Planctomycetaceae bacterium]